MKTIKQVSSSDPLEFFPASILDMRSTVGRIVSFTSADVISEMRDYAEGERYKEKSEVDAYLINSEATKSVCHEIETSFDDADPVAAAKAYISLFRSDMRLLHDFHVTAALSCDNYSHQDWQTFWRAVVPLADRDNGHAMFLSSDNWPFSVFHKLIEEIESFTDPNDISMIAPILA